MVFVYKGRFGEFNVVDYCLILFCKSSSKLSLIFYLLIYKKLFLVLMNSYFSAFLNAYLGHVPSAFIAKSMRICFIV